MSNPTPAPHPIGVTKINAGDPTALVEETRTSPRKSGRFYVHPSTHEDFPSVTTVIAATTGKPFLVPWAAKLAAEFTIANLDAVVEVYKTIGKDAAIDVIKGEARRLREERRDFGSEVHGIVDVLVKGGAMPDYDDTIAQYVDSFIKWWIDFNVVPIFTETTVCRREISPGKRGYAGTADLGVECDVPWAPGHRLRVLVDTKTGERIDNGMAEQLAAYLRSDEVWIRETGQVIRQGDMSRCWCPNPEPGPGPHTVGSHFPDLQAAFVLHLRPDGYRFLPVQTDGAVYENFLRRLEQWHYNDSRGERVVGLPLRPLVDGQPAPRPCDDVLTPALVKNLAASGFYTMEQVRDATDTELLKIKGIGKKTIEKVRAAQSVIGEVWIPDGLTVPGMETETDAA